MAQIEETLKSLDEISERFPDLKLIALSVKIEDSGSYGVDREFYATFERHAG